MLPTFVFMNCSEINFNFSMVFSVQAMKYWEVLKMELTLKSELLIFIRSAVHLSRLNWLLTSCKMIWKAIFLMQYSKQDKNYWRILMKKFTKNLGLIYRKVKPIFQNMNPGYGILPGIS